MHSCFHSPFLFIFCSTCNREVLTPFIIRK
nr:MAG TPA: Molybdenum Cofactor Synthesis C [Caudoviricetes sp.]